MLFSLARSTGVVGAPRRPVARSTGQTAKLISPITDGTATRARNSSAEASWSASSRCAILAALPEGQLPYFREGTLEHALQPGYDFGDEFEVGLDLILDGLAQQLASADRGHAS